jgi:ribonuclease VapC
VIAVDTSALMAILLDEPEAKACIGALEADGNLLISAGTVAEALIVAGRRNVGEEMARLIDGLGFEIVSVTSASARRIANAYAAWGKGVHPAALNLGDCFAYEVAKDRRCPLLFVGGDFAETDVECAVWR